MHFPLIYIFSVTLFSYISLPILYVSIEIWVDIFSVDTWTWLCIQMAVTRKFVLLSCKNKRLATGYLSLKLCWFIDLFLFFYFTFEHVIFIFLMLHIGISLVYFAIDVSLETMHVLIVAWREQYIFNWKFKLYKNRASPLFKSSSTRSQRRRRPSPYTLFSHYSQSFFWQSYFYCFYIAS